MIAGSPLRRAALAVALALSCLAVPPTALAQYAVDAGEAIAATRLEVVSAPSRGAAKVMEVEPGRTVTVLGYPRGTGMAWIAIGGRELGYVPASGLAPLDRQRPVLFRAAVVADARAPGGGLPGDQLDGAGQIVALADVRDGKASLAGARPRQVPVTDLLPIMGTYGTGSLASGAPGFFAARLGRFASLGEAKARWAELQAVLPELKGLSPYLFRRATAEGIGVELAAAPFDRSRVEELCTLIARRGRDCWVVAVDIR